MSERTLDDVVRQLRMAASYLQTAEDRADQLLKNHDVAMMVHKNIYDLKDTIAYLDHEYRQSHYRRRSRWTAF